jgi:hypothetical protein
LADLILFLHAHRDSFASVQHRSMIPPPEGISNFMRGGFGVAPSQIHRHLARECNIRRATFAGHIRDSRICVVRKNKFPERRRIAALRRQVALECVLLVAGGSLEPDSALSQSKEHV